MIFNSAVAVALLAATAVASPTPPTPRAPRNTIRKRYTQGEDCTSDIVAHSDKKGLLFAVDSEGITLDCDDVGDASADA